MADEEKQGISDKDFVKALAVINDYLRENISVVPKVIMRIEPTGEYYYKISL